MHLRFIFVSPRGHSPGRVGSWERGAAVEITGHTLVADIAAHHPRSIEFFARYGIDFCCGGPR
jgi:hypothetical protein